MENRISPAYRLISLTLFFAGSIFIITYSAEVLLDRVNSGELQCNSSLHLERTCHLLSYYLEAKQFVLFRIGIERLIIATLCGIVILPLILRKIAKTYYYKVLPLFLGHSFKKESDEFRHRPFNLSQIMKKKIRDEKEAKADIKRINHRYDYLKSTYNHFFGGLRKLPLLKKLLMYSDRLVDYFQRRSFKRFRDKSLYESTFVGNRENGVPFSINEVQRSKHLEVIGKSGTGKTKSVLIPIAAQDMLVGKSVIIVNGKGDQNFPSLAYAAAKAAKREKDFLFFNLAFPEKSHTYNPLHMGKYGDPLVIADRMFSVLGYKSEYYKDVAFNFFKNLIFIMAETGKPFNIRDIYICLCSRDAIDYVCNMSSAKRHIKLLNWSIESIDKQREDTLSGLKTKLEFYCNDLLNAYNPDIIVEDIIEKDQIVFFSLNINMMPTLAPAIARLFLRELQQHIGGREADLRRNQNPCSIILDEFSTFIYKHFHVAISQFREGNAQLTFAHQSGVDLNLFEKELGAVVWDNAQTKIILAQDDSIQCQKISEMIGTRKVIERTERFTRGFMFIRKPTFESSNKYVDEFLFHPNKIKKLEPYGQGYVLTTKEHSSERKKRASFDCEFDEKKMLRIAGVNFGIFPDSFYSEPKVERKTEVDGLNLSALFLDNTNESTTPNKKVNTNVQSERILSWD